MSSSNEEWKARALVAEAQVQLLFQMQENAEAERKRQSEAYERLQRQLEITINFMGAGMAATGLSGTGLPSIAPTAPTSSWATIAGSSALNPNASDFRSSNPHVRRNSPSEPDEPLDPTHMSPQMRAEHRAISDIKTLSAKYQGEYSVPPPQAPPPELEGRALVLWLRSQYCPPKLYGAYSTRT